MRQEYDLKKVSSLALQMPKANQYNAVGYFKDDGGTEISCHHSSCPLTVLPTRPIDVLFLGEI